MRFYRSLIGMGVIALLQQVPVYASNADQEEGPRPPRPPKEVLEACNGKKAGDTVSFNDRQGRSVKATCVLIAMPERPMANK